MGLQKLCVLQNNNYIVKIHRSLHLKTFLQPCPNFFYKEKKVLKRNNIHLASLAITAVKDLSFAKPSRGVKTCKRKPSVPMMYIFLL